MLKKQCIYDYQITNKIFQNITIWNYSAIDTIDRNNQIIISFENCVADYNQNMIIMIIIESTDDKIDPDINCLLSYAESITSNNNALEKINNVTKISHMSHNNRLVYQCTWTWFKKNENNKLSLKIDNNKQNVKITCLTESKNIFCYYKGIYKLMRDKPIITLEKN